jgi:hypothetical protein
MAKMIGYVVVYGFAVFGSWIAYNRLCDLQERANRAS